MSKGKRIFFHTGLQRTGTTFLQKNVFPHIVGLTYITKKGYRDFVKNHKKYPDGDYLVTHEFNEGFKEETADFAKAVDADIYPLLVIRRHADWLLSQYKRYLKNGDTSTITAFFDPEDIRNSELNDDALQYFEKILHLEKLFGNKPKVVVYQRLRETPQQLIFNLVAWMDANVEFEKIDFSPRHTSYSESQLKFFLWLCEKVGHADIKRKKWFRYPMLYLSRLIPEKVYSTVEWPSKQFLNQVDKLYSEDWQNCLAYVQSEQA